MDKIKISTAQFENRSGDKDYNLSKIESLAQKAALEGSHVIAFHECSVTGYTFARHLSREQMLDLAEFIPEGPSVSKVDSDCSKEQTLLFWPDFSKKTKRISYIKLMSVLVKLD